jgi:serine/threonine protein kinase
MSEFRAALQLYLAGTLSPEETRRRVAAAAASEPQVASGMLAVIDAYQSAGRLTPDFAAGLQQLVRRSAGLPAPASAPEEATRRNQPAMAASPAPRPSPPVAPASVAGAAAPAATPAPLSSFPPAPRPISSAELTVGSVLKGRFVIESIVAGGDKGGMGVVFKALDRIKQDAQDRNPYVAIKVLNEDFKSHPDSVIALQREARRAQSLAHPNIITVYDFDRDGDLFFMAMELLNGSPLDVVIRDNRERGGLPVKEALKIIQQLGRGLGYAHANNIVHSDFKPSNAFVTKDGVVKVLDFGIARATKLPDGEKTRFDAGSLGAMTLPYASCEQFERQDPDPSDDVYALAVVSYELLTGRHPFERPDPDKPGRLIRTDAIAARNAKMKPAPAPIPGLNRQQWRTMQRALAFSRANRLRNAAEFLEGMTPRKVQTASLMLAITAGVLLLVTSTILVYSYLQRSRLQALTQRLQSTDPAVVAAALQSLRQYPANERAPVLLNDAVQGTLVNYFIGRARDAFDVEAGRYDYAGAVAGIKEAQSLSKAYEDSRQLSDALDRIESERKAEILRQADLFQSELNQGVLIASQGANNVRSTLGIIRQLDPNYALLNDKRLPIVFATQVRSKIDSNQLALAGALLTAGLQFAPSDTDLLDLQDRIKRQQSVAQLTAQTGELERAVGPLATASALADFRTQRPQIEALRRAQPNSAVLGAAQDQLVRLITPLVSRAVQNHQVNEGQDAINEFSDLLPPAFVAKQRSEMASVTGDTQARDNAAAQLRAKIDKESANPQPDDAWVSTLKRDLQGLAAVAGASDPAIEQARSRTSQAFLAQSNKLLASRRLTESQRVLDLAKDFGLPADSYQTQAAAVTQARAQLEAENRAHESAALLLAAKQRVLDQALADHIDVARTQFEQLRKTLPANDPFVTTDAPRALAESYLARARRQAMQTHFDEALQDAQAAEQAAPNLPEFQGMAQRFQAARDLARSLAMVQDFRPLRPELERVREAERNSGSQKVQMGLRSVVVERLTRVGAQDPAAAMQLRQSALPLFPNLPAISSAGTLARTSTPQNTPVPNMTPAQNTPAAQTTPTPNPTLPPTLAPQQSVPVASANNQPRNSAPAVTPMSAATSAQPSAQPSAQVSTPSATTSPIAVASAALGPCSAIAPDAAVLTACRDPLGKAGRGPEMVIIPAGIELGTYLMMRNEASVADYNQYCASVKGCTQVTGADSDLPITSISVDDAQKYAAWLSSASGVKYRLPTEREWKRAAGRQRDLDANCTVPGRSPQGIALRPTTVGNLNELGMRNVVGNAQEWATTAGGGLRALGGAIGDPIDTCQTLFSRPHDGKPDGRTGFRLLREMR